MSIYGDRDYADTNRARYNSLERNKMEYFFPNNQSGNRTIEYGDKEFYKPRINKNKRMNRNNYSNDNYDLNSNNYYSKKNLNNSIGGYTSYKLEKADLENMPKIVRNKKNVNKYINKANNNNNIREKLISKDFQNLNNNNDNNINLYNPTQRNNFNRNDYMYNINPIKRNKSIDSSNYRYSESKKDYNINNNKNNGNYKNNNYNNYINNYQKYNRNSNRENQTLRSTRNSSFDNKSRASDYFTYLFCKTCFDKKMLEKENEKNGNSLYIDKKELLNDRFINENPFYFIDKMGDNERKRINDKIESNSNKQRLALANYRKEIDNPKNNTKERLQLMNEYSLNPLTIEAGIDPRYLKQKKNYDKKEKIIHQNPDIYKGLEPRKAYNDYYSKCIYQIPKIEESYYLNPVYKNNYIKALKKQIEDKRNKEAEDRRKQREGEALANKRFNEYKRLAKLNELESHNRGIQKMKDDNKELDDFKRYKNDVLKEQERQLGNELAQMKNQVDKDFVLRSKNAKDENKETYRTWLDDIERKAKQKRDNLDEENKKWNNYIERYKYRCNHDTVYANCDLCNRPYEKDKLKRFPPRPSEMVEYNINKVH